jgi:hypothetical protein
MHPFPGDIHPPEVRGLSIPQRAFRVLAAHAQSDLNRNVTHLRRFHAAADQQEPSRTPARRQL